MAKFIVDRPVIRHKIDIVMESAKFSDREEYYKIAQEIGGCISKYTWNVGPAPTSPYSGYYDPELYIGKIRIRLFYNRILSDEELYTLRRRIGEKEEELG